MLKFTFDQTFRTALYREGSGFDNKLSQSNCTLESLLEDEIVIKQLKQQNKNLIKFLDKEKIKTLVKYITIEPESDEILRGHKYPYISCELLKCDVSQISDYFAMSDNEYLENHPNTNIKKEEQQITIEIIDNNKEDGNNIEIKEDKLSEKNSNNNNNIELLDMLLMFIMNDNKELNYVLSGYFSSVLIELIDKYPSRILKYLFNKRKDAVGKIIKHSNQKSISQIVIKILNIENYVNVSNNQNLGYTSEIEKIITFRNSLIVQLITSINIDTNQDIEYENKFVILEELLDNNKQLVYYVISSREIITHLFNVLSTNIDENNLSDSQSIFKLFIYFLINLLKKIKLNELPFPILDESSLQIEPFYGEKIIKNLFALLKNFTKRKNAKIIEFPIGEKIECLGELNLSILLLVNELFDIMKNIPNRFDNILIRSGFIKQSIDFFFEYKWNDIYLQNFVLLISNIVFNEKDHQELCKYIFGYIKLHEVIIDSFGIRTLYNFPNSHNDIQTGTYSNLVHLAYQINTIISDSNNNIKLNGGTFQFLSTEDSSNNPFDKLRSYQTEGITNENIKMFFGDKWEKFFSLNIEKEVILYNQKLCQNEIKKNAEESLDLSEEKDIFDDDEKIKDNVGMYNDNCDEKKERDYSDNIFWKGKETKFIYNESEMEEMCKELLLD